MPYKPTGNPPGRPKTVKPVEAAKAAAQLVPCPCGCGAYTSSRLAQQVEQVTTRSEMPFSDSPSCPVCHPDGWPKGVTGYGCPHGTWARRI